MHTKANDSVQRTSASSLPRRCGQGRRLLPGLAGAIALAASAASWAQCTGDFSEELTLDWNSISPGLTAGSNYSGSATIAASQGDVTVGISITNTGTWNGSGTGAGGGRPGLDAGNLALGGTFDPAASRSPSGSPSRTPTATPCRSRTSSSPLTISTGDVLRFLSGPGDDLRRHLDTRSQLDGDRRRHRHGHRRAKLWLAVRKLLFGLFVSYQDQVTISAGTWTPGSGWTGSGGGTSTVTAPATNTGARRAAG